MHQCAGFCWANCSQGKPYWPPLVECCAFNCRAADKAYDADWIRNMIWEQGAIAVVPLKSNRKMPKEFGAELYKQRNLIERFAVDGDHTSGVP